MFNNQQSKVVLPIWLLNQSKSLEASQFQYNVQRYLDRYPGYVLKGVIGGLAICEIQREEKLNGKI
ncbi:hypothetical protein LS684_04270 [Cytobacillus spongiae]|uniref:hypothetical protein n=1 Tax=Cytobacillus spongiae TaxID=2901381 RepID=UPI001F384FB5|nr:hypothetical protein [Cytobacillus spongiae]UII56687.1 hypothetical protein LS684_04270 [Cytobacillus spongiae]